MTTPVPPIAIADLPTLDRAALLTLWRSLFATPVPKGLSQPFLQRLLAFELQARAHGGLPAPLVAKLARLASGTDRAATPALRPGGRYVREWNGVTHVVEVTDAGFRWQGATHRSLSAIARAITGAHWSGPRFFGITKTRPASAKIATSVAKARKVKVSKASLGTSDDAGLDKTISPSHPVTRALSRLLGPA